MLAQMMDQLGQSNPQMAMLVQMMQARTAAVSNAVDTLDRDTTDALAVRLARTEEQLAATRANAARILASYRAAKLRLADLAAALGACGLCWGEDGECPSCRGRGHIGMIRPDQEIRARLLGPSRQSTPIAEHSTGPRT